ncbi:MAG: pilus assembly protein [Chloroflexi bacterium]|nr:pilus assembly protein [Chloroflexota bacterium]
MSELLLIDGDHNAQGRGEKGQAVVEFALAAGVLFMLMIGSIDIGRAIWNYDTLAEAVREGARFAAINGYNSSTPTGPPNSTNYTAGPPGQDSGVTSVVRNYAFGMAPASISVFASWPSGDNLIGSSVVITASYSFQPLTTLVVGRPFTLTAASARTILR